MTELLDWRKESDEVFYCNTLTEFIDRNTVSRLKALAKDAPRKRARLCIHAEPEKPLHQMLIVHPAGAYVRPHMHLDRDETFQVLEGLATLYFFDRKGEVQYEKPMGVPESNRPFLIMIPSGHYHTIYIETEELVFLESTVGPFRKSDLVEAPWSPQSESLEEAGAYIRTLGIKAR